MVDGDSQHLARSVLHEGLGQHRPVVVRFVRGIHRRVEDGIRSVGRDGLGLVDQPDPDGILADGAGGDIVVGAGAHGVVEAAHQVGDGFVSEVVLQLDEADDIGVDGNDGGDDLVPLPGEFLRAICAAAFLDLVGTADPGTQVQRGEVVEHVETGDQECSADLLRRVRALIHPCEDDVLRRLQPVEVPGAARGRDQPLVDDARQTSDSVPGPQGVLLADVGDGVGIVAILIGVHAVVEDHHAPQVLLSHGDRLGTQR